MPGSGAFDPRGWIPLEPFCDFNAGPAAVATTDAMVGAKNEYQAKRIDDRVNKHGLGAAQSKMMNVVAVAGAAIQGGTKESWGFILAFPGPGLKKPHYHDETHKMKLLRREASEGRQYYRYRRISCQMG